MLSGFGTQHGFVLNFNTIFYATVVLCLVFRNTVLCYFYFVAFKLEEIELLLTLRVAFITYVQCYRKCFKLWTLVCNFRPTMTI